MRVLGLAACVATSLQGCAELETAKQQQKMDSALSPYIGRSIAEYVGARGPPQFEYEIGKNKKSFQWVITGQSAAGGAVLSGGVVVARPAQTLICRVTFAATSDKPAPTYADWKIESFQWAGAC